MKKILTICFLIPNLLLNLLFTKQNSICSLLAQEFYPKLQSYITPSPQAAALTKYGDYPVNYNTGLVDMRIPIYTIKSGDINLPIGISFHASGRMANETNGVLGMRWVLNAGGVITRTVHGYPDDWDRLALYSANPNQTPNYDELRRSCTDGFISSEYDPPLYVRTDSEFDVFSYVLPSGKSGKFILKNDNGIKKAVQIPYEALKIELEQDSTYYSKYGAVKIIDTDGTIYNYGDGKVFYSGYCEFNANEDDIPGKFGRTPTGWYLKSIVSADKKDIIEFDYQNVHVSKMFGSETVTILDRMRDYDNVYPDAYDLYGINLYNYLFELPKEYNYGTSQIMIVPVLKSIKFNEGELNFNYGTTNSQVSTDNKYLQNITLTGAVNRKFKFNQELDPNENFIRYLIGFDVVSVINEVEKTEEKYVFDYYRPSNSNSTFSLGFSSDKKDWWGYYNYNTNYILPYKSVNYNRNNYGSFEVVYRTIGNNVTRDPDLESMKLGMLKSIIYPTGGETEFEYELNYYKEVPFSSVIKPGPGLRIKKVTNKPINGKEIFKTYKYGENEDKVGYINTTLWPSENTVQESGMMHYWDSFVGENAIVTENQAGYRIRTFSADPLINSDDFGGNIVRYNLVTEYSETDQQRGYSGEYYNEGKNGKTIYEYSQKNFDTKQFEITDREYYIDYPKLFANPYNFWQGGELLFKTLYKKENGLFVPTIKESYNYKDTTFEEVWDMPIYRHVNFSYNMIYNGNFSHVNSSTLGNYMYNKEKDYHNNTCSVYGYGFRKYVSGSEKIASKTIEHFDGDGIATTTEYFYDPQYDQLRKEEIIKSDGKRVGFQYNYAFDKTLLPLSDMTNVYNKMLNMNMVSIPLSKSQYEMNGANNVFIQSKRTEFYEPFTNVVCPKTEYYKKGNEFEEAILQYHSYDEKGNILEVSKLDGMRIVYIWGYDKKYLVAKIENMIYSNIPVNLITAIETSSSQSGSESSLLNALDNLRNHASLSGAMVTTYTYKPLIGMTSMTDSKGDVTYYEYDSYGRLEKVKDKENNILSKNQYHYKNQ